ncbi:hypothetical protein ACYJ51_28325, partial [Klebsiella pneumoniae]
ALGIRQVNYTLAEVSYFLLLLIEFRIEIQKSNICQTCSVFTEISHDIDFQSISMASVTINPRVVDKLWELTNSASAVNTQAFDEPPDSAEAMNIVTNAVKQVPGTVAVNQPPIDSNQPPVNSNRPTTALPAAPGLSPASASSPAVRSMTDSLLN